MEVDLKHTNIEERKKYDVSYVSVIVIAYSHLAALYGIYICFTKAKWISLLYTYATFLLSALGIVVGAHKLWSHRAFKATRSLETFLMLCHSMAYQFTVYKWVILHRLHHQHSDTASDPHDASRGLFYSHMGWVMVRRPGGSWGPEVAKLVEDIRTNPILDFQRRHAYWFLPTLAFILPTITPLLWDEDISTSWHLTLLRFVINMNMTGAVNSISHTWGYRPYDARLKAAQSWLIIFLTLGEGHHNFHHAFPYDYRACERSQRWTNAMAMFIDVCAKLGLAYDLRVAEENVVKMKKDRRGDGSDFGKRFLGL